MSDVLYAGAGILSATQLPCGRKLQNRLVKVAMYEHLAALFGGPPNALHHALYSRWGRGGWGMIITGNVQVCSDHLSLGRDITIPEFLDEEALRSYRTLVSVIHGDSEDDTSSSNDRPLAIMQLSHTGRQSPNVIGGRWPLVPPNSASAVPMALNTKQQSGVLRTSLLSYIVRNLLFQPPRPMSIGDVDHTVKAFVRGAQLAAKTGFDGVEIHAGHGYLIAQFMSQKTNTRTDEYSSRSNPLLLLHRIMLSIRSPGVVPEDFALGVKLNAADYVDTGTGLTSSEDRALHHLKTIASWGLVDFIEVSGGDYDSPDFISGSAHSHRQAVFASFSQRAMHALISDDANELSKRKRPLILLTGGLRSPELMESALAQNHADLLGVGRFSVHCPEFPNVLTQLPTSTPENIFPYANPRANAELPLRYSLEQNITSTVLCIWNAIPTTIRPMFPHLIGAGTESARYSILMRALAYRQEKTYYPGEGPAVVFRFWWFIAPGSWSLKTQHWVVLMSMFVALCAVFGMFGLR